MIKNHKNIFVIVIQDYKGGELGSFTQEKSVYSYITDCIIDKLSDGILEMEELETFEEDFEDIIANLDLQEFTALYAGAGSAVHLHTSELEDIHIDEEILLDIMRKKKKKLIREVKKLVASYNEDE